MKYLIWIGAAVVGVVLITFAVIKDNARPPAPVVTETPTQPPATAGLTAADIKAAVTEATAGTVAQLADLQKALAAAQKRLDELQQPVTPDPDAVAGGDKATTPDPAGGVAQASTANRDASVKAENSGTVVNVEQNPTFIINSPGGASASASTKAPKVSSHEAQLWGVAAVGGFFGWVAANMAAIAANAPAPAPQRGGYMPPPSQPAPSPTPVGVCDERQFDGARPLVRFHPDWVRGGKLALTLDSYQGQVARLCVVFFDHENPGMGDSANRANEALNSNGVSYTFAVQGSRFNIAGFLANGTPFWGYVAGNGNCNNQYGPFRVVCAPDGAAAYQIVGR